MIRAVREWDIYDSSRAHRAGWQRRRRTKEESICLSVSSPISTLHTIKSQEKMWSSPKERDSCAGAVATSYNKHQTTNIEFLRTYMAVGLRSNRPHKQRGILAGGARLGDPIRRLRRDLELCLRTNNDFEGDRGYSWRKGILSGGGDRRRKKI